ncbi:MAG: DUF5119 domain-containing protein [Bacteroidaceae bacterium]|nr:DUF5119 domain-containing protein [Bacteroidaceae bacterium]
MTIGLNLYRAIAKIQVFLCLSASLIFNSACHRKELFLRVDQTQILVEIYDINLDLLWGIEWETQWQYNWNESNVEFGLKGYTQPELIKGTIYNVDPNTGRRFSSFVKIFDSRGGRLSLNSGSMYDMLFYNFGTEYTSFYQSDDYSTYTASTRVSSRAQWIRTRSESDNSEMPDTTRTYIDYNQPDELFGTLVTGLKINEDPSSYEKEISPDGTITYIYRIDAPLRPFSFIYMFQIIILNNADDKGDRIIGAKGLTVTGLAQGVELFTRRTFNNTISISLDDVKPMQNHENVILEDGSTVDKADIMAARMLTWGLPGMNPIESSKAITRAPDIDKNYIGIGLTLRNGYTYIVTRNITEAMHVRPTGGVVTIYIDANEVPQDILEQKPQQGSGGFGAEVDDWSNEVNAEVTI